MKGLLSSMSTGTKGMLVFMGLLFPVVMMAGTHNPSLMAWFMGAYILLGVIGGLGVFFAGHSKKKKSKEFSENIEKDAAASASGLMTERMVEMEESFQRGINIYKEYGKDLYSLPWFVVVGESGSGKTQAIKRSEIGFPDKLQNFWQGEGGTMSMHWWFTNQAVILDTAGKLFVKDSNQDDGSEALWLEFLKMLKRNRPDCPINGLCLVIPANSLIPKASQQQDEDSYREIDEKAGQISRQMETLRQELGVRFPVHILVTKMDQIVGFREYFDDLDSPEDRFQILGWSNPAPLDDKFKPSTIRKHLKETADRLRKKTMSTMKNPVSLSTNGKRIDDLDALYSLPKSIEGLSPKLERYLASIFSTNQWSSEPPFLRGVYFSSALQQGAVLDESLASSLGMSLEEYERSNLKEDLSMVKSRSYFLRDLFQEKIFKEKGLVIKEGRTSKGLKGWKLATLITAASLILVVGLLGWLTGIQKPKETEHWSYIANEAYSTKDGGFYPIYVKNTAGDWIYRKSPIDAEEIVENLNQLGKLNLGKRPKMGWVLTPASLMDGDVKQERKEAYTNAVNGIILSKLVDASLESLEENSSEWAQSSIGKADREALETILQFCAGKKIDTKKQLESLYRVTGIPYTRRGKSFKTLYEPLILSVERAHDGSVSVPEYVDKEKLTSVMDALFVGQGGRLLPVLNKYDDAWLRFAALGEKSKYGDYVKLAEELSVHSNELKGFAPRISDILANEGVASEEEFNGDPSEPNQFGIYLIDEYDKVLEKFASEELEEWEGLVSSDEEVSAAKRAKEIELINKYCLVNKNEIRHVALSSLIDEVMDIDKIVENPRRLRAVQRFDDKIKSIKASAKDLGELDVIKATLDTSISQYVASEYKESLSFPLIYDAKVGGGVDEELELDDVAALSLLAKILEENSTRSAEKLDMVLGVAGCLIDMAELEEGKVQPIIWELTLDNKEWTAAEKVYVRPTKGQDLTWDFESGGNAREITCHSGAEIWFSNFNSPKNSFKTGNNYKQWAPVHWALSQIGSGRSGAIGQVGNHTLKINVRLPDGFPSRSLDLPTSEKF